MPETKRRKEVLDAKKREQQEKKQKLRQVYQDKVREVEIEHRLALENERSVAAMKKQLREQQREGGGCHGNGQEGVYDGKSNRERVNTSRLSAGDQHSTSSNHSSEGRSRRLVMVGQRGQHQDAIATAVGGRQLKGSNGTDATTNPLFPPAAAGSSKNTDCYFKQPQLKLLTTGVSRVR